MTQKITIIACICLFLGLGIYGLSFIDKLPPVAVTPYSPQITHKNPAITNPIQQPATSVEPSAMWHTSITATVFWAGETASSENGFISNQPSAWDENWAAHAGHENPYYIALPYNDIDDDGNQKPEKYCAAFSPQPGATQQCKNTWVEIIYNNKTVYAQWEDVGPFGETDSAYVFGGSTPANRQDTGAGVDLSPATRDYLGMGDVGQVAWRFVTLKTIPVGPWKNIITNSTY